MRKLLERWAAIEPGRCKPVENDYFKISQSDGNWHVVYPENLTIQDLMWLQWAVQEAATSRGRFLEIYYAPGLDWEARITVPEKYKAEVYGSNPAEALLSAYLRALEVSK